MQTSFVLSKCVKAWLLLGIAMVFLQILIGGITRLTGSGLSITKWDIVTGVIPPLNENLWNIQFDLYKQTPQYQKINDGMTLDKFKWIYFWEYLHRLWARSMGFVFIIPLTFFWIRNLLNKSLKRDLIIVFFLACLSGAFGWIMVASGLINRPWVNAYKLSLHLGLALLTLSYLWWTYLKAVRQGETNMLPHGFRQFSLIFLLTVSVQILLGGMMSGMKAALMYPTFPMMGAHIIDPIIFESNSWHWVHFKDYDVYPFLSALVQLLHRFLAMTILSLSIIGWIKWKLHLIKWIGLILIVQILLGVLTLICSKGTIPVGLGVFHQGFGILLLLCSVKWYFVCLNLKMKEK
ncbi:MAG: COX15/CtaA family protein [Saprospiraceae bacterium]